MEDRPEVVQPREVRWEVFDPSGKRVEHYSANMRSDGERVRFEIPFAWNDPAGPRRVRAREIASSATAETTFELRS